MPGVVPSKSTEVGSEISKPLPLSSIQLPPESASIERKLVKSNTVFIPTLQTVEKSSSPALGASFTVMVNTVDASGQIGSAAVTV